MPNFLSGMIFAIWTVLFIIVLVGYAIPFIDRFDRVVCMLEEELIRRKHNRRKTKGERNAN